MSFEVTIKDGMVTASRMHQLPSGSTLYATASGHMPLWSSRAAVLAIVDAAMAETEALMQKQLDALGKTP